MPIIRDENKANQMKSVLNPSLEGFCTEWVEATKNMIHEGANLKLDPVGAVLDESAQVTLKDFFCRDSFLENGLTADELKDRKIMQEQMFENDTQAILEYAAGGTYNPTIGLVFPMHKLLMMNSVYDNSNAIEKCVATSPKFTITMMNRYLVTPTGEKLDLSIDQMKLTDAVNATRPEVPVELDITENGTTDILAAINGTAGLDNLSIDTKVTGLKLYVKYAKDDKTLSGELITDENGKVVLETIPVNIQPKPSYNKDFERSVTASFKIPAGVVANSTGTSLSGSLTEEILSVNIKNNRVYIRTQNGANSPIQKVVLTAKKDASNGLLNTVSVVWDSTTTLEEIETATPISVALSSEEIKDINALYNASQVNLTLGMIKDILGNYKDDTIRTALNKSWKTMPSKAKIEDKFDFATKDGYYGSPRAWREDMFMDFMSTYVGRMHQVLNDPNVSVTVFGTPDIIRKVKPKEVTFDGNPNVGSVPLEFNRSVVTTDGYKFNFMSSQKNQYDEETKDQLVCILRPTNGQRIIYRVYDYQLFLSNEVRNTKFYTLPAIYAYERFKFVEYQPVQGRIKILNPTGLTA